MVKKRLVASLILRDGLIVQSVGFKHTNIIGDAITAISFFNQWAVDEIVLLDVSRDTKKRDRFYPIVEALSCKCFVPLTVGGWVTSVDEMRRLLRIGADKIVINTAAYRDPEFLKECARIFGNQCVVVSIDVKRNQQGSREVVIDRGREWTGRDPVEWAREASTYAGEIYLTSVDHDGGLKGYDLELMRVVSAAVDVPVVAFGGVGEWSHLVDGITFGGVEAVAAANILHYKELSARRAKDHMRANNIDVR